jgi:hypothetical protein
MPLCVPESPERLGIEGRAVSALLATGAAVGAAAVVLRFRGRAIDYGL